MSSSEVEQKARFDRIRYAQSWEDCDILLEALNIKENDTCLSIAAAGDNTLALLSKRPEKVYAIDCSQPQLYCLQLRIAAYSTLDHRALLELFGSVESSRRSSLLLSCCNAMPEDAALFWRTHAKAVERHGIGGIGRFEGYFRVFRRFILPLVHPRKKVKALLEDKSRAAREEFYKDEWNTWRWRLMLNTFFSSAVMGRFGRDTAFFQYATEGLSSHVARRVAHAFVELNPADNPYLHWILLGQHREVLPFALREENFDNIRENLHRLELRKQSLEDFCQSNVRIDVVNLSDVFEYMSLKHTEETYKRLLSCANPGARLAYWNMLVPRKCPSSLEGHIIAHNSQAARLFSLDKAFFYSKFIVEEVE